MMERTTGNGRGLFFDGVTEVGHASNVDGLVVGFVFYGCFGPVREDEVCFDVEAAQDEEELYAEDCAGCAGYCYDLGWYELGLV